VFSLNDAMRALPTASFVWLCLPLFATAIRMGSVLSDRVRVGLAGVVADPEQQHGATQVLEVDPRRLLSKRRPAIATLQLMDAMVKDLPS